MKVTKVIPPPEVDITYETSFTHGELMLVLASLYLVGGSKLDGWVFAETGGAASGRHIDTMRTSEIMSAMMRDLEPHVNPDLRLARVLAERFPSRSGCA